MAVFLGVPVQQRHFVRGQEIAQWLAGPQPRGDVGQAARQGMGGRQRALWQQRARPRHKQQGSNWSRLARQGVGGAFASAQHKRRWAKKYDVVWIGFMQGLGLGLVWGVWHLPLFFIDGTAQAHVPPALFLLGVVAMSVVFAWLVNRTAGSVVAALLFHTAINFWPSVVPVLPTESSYRAYAFVVATLVLLAVVALLTSGPMVAQSSPGSTATDHDTS